MTETKEFLFRIKNWSGGWVGSKQVSSSLGLQAGRQGSKCFQMKIQYKAMSIFKQKCKVIKFSFGPLLAQKVKVLLS